jgi:hypothetical protein
VHLQDRRARPDDFTALTPQVAWSTDPLQAAAWWGQGRVAGQGPLTGRFSGAINIEDQIATPCPIPHPAYGLLGPAPRQGGGHKQGTDRFETRGVNGGKKATECGAMWEAVPLKKRHERARKRLQSIEIRLQGTLPADGVAEEEGQKVQHLILADRVFSC